MRYLVTGGAGFIGSNIADALLGRGDEVTVLDNLSTGRRVNIEPYLDNERFRLIEGTITDPDTCAEACRGADAVFHQAAMVSVPGSIEDPSGTAAVNVGGTVNVFEAARGAGIRSVVWASSTAVYGNAEQLPNVETMELCPLSPYAASKAAGEMFARSYAEVYDMRIVGLRYFNVYGRRQDPGSAYAAVIPLFITRLLAGTPVTIFGDGEQTRDFVHIENVVQANLRAADSPPAAAGRAFNIGCGEYISINRLYTTIAGELGMSVQPEYAPSRVGEVRDSVADISAARSVLGYDPQITVDEGLRRTIGWYKKETNRQE